LARRPLIGLLYQPRMIDDDECGAVGGMRIGRGNRSTRRKPAPVPLCPPQIPYNQTRAAVVGSRQLTASARARSHCCHNLHNKFLNDVSRSSWWTNDSYLFHNLFSLLCLRKTSPHDQSILYTVLTPIVLLRTSVHRLHISIPLFPFSAYFSILKMEAANSSETSVISYKIASPKTVIFKVNSFGLSYSS
jgi:hypothetical protein